MAVELAYFGYGSVRFVILRCDAFAAVGARCEVRGGGVWSELGCPVWEVQVSPALRGGAGQISRLRPRFAQHCFVSALPGPHQGPWATTAHMLRMERNSISCHVLACTGFDPGVDV